MESDTCHYIWQGECTKVSALVSSWKLKIYFKGIYDTSTKREMFQLDEIW